MILYHPALSPQLIDYGILVPVKKDRSKKVFEELQNELGFELTSTPIETIPKISKEEMLLAHDSSFINSLYHVEEREAELIKAYELLDQSGNYHRYDPQQGVKPLGEMLSSIEMQVGACYQAGVEALNHQFCYFLGGGMHHAMTWGGRGFCPVNDIVIGIRKLQKEKKVRCAWVIDVDAHKGCGTAQITHNDPTILTLSIHMADSWPLDGPEFDQFGKRNDWHIPSNVDIPIQEKSESLYCSKLLSGLKNLERMSQVGPDLVYIVQGADPYEKDELTSTNKLNLSLGQLEERDQLVFDFFKERNIPQAYLMAGGYGDLSYQVYLQFLLANREFVR